jgi:Ca2+/Na+ antiporter
LIAISVGVVVGSQFSRWTGVVGASLLAISAIWWMPFYPVWSLVYIGIGILVVYALVAYGSRESVELSAL